MSSETEGVKAKFGREDMLELVKAAGRRVIGTRVQCPLVGCKDEGEKCRPNGNIFKGKAGWVLHCHRCHETADYIALYQVVKGVDFAAALAQLAGAQPAKKQPHLTVVRTAPVSLEGKRPSAEVLNVWNGLEPHDLVGEAYLEQRRLAELVGLGYVRFATEASAVPEVKAKGKAGYRVGLLLADVTGRAMGIQFRSAIAGERDKVRSLSRGLGKHVFFGRPGDIVESHTVVVTEGIADTLTALLWVKGRAGVAVAGAPGTGQVAGLADALELAGVDLVGRTFLLLAQHDRGPRGNSSLVAFSALKSRLQQAGATVLLESQPPGDGSKDWADAHREHALPEWPPAQLQRQLEADDVEAEDSMVLAPGAAVWQAREPVEPEHYGKDLTTLEFLLSATAHREPILGKGFWEFNDMTGRVEYGRKPLSEADFTRVRMQLESYRGSLDSKKLKFPERDIAAVANVLAARAPYNPVKSYLETLKWDGTDRFLEQLPTALHLDQRSAGLEIECLRKWFISAVARAFQPGCKADCVLVLQGGQGERKSGFFETIGGRWFSATSAELGSVNSVEVLRRSWIVELDEMDAVIRTREFSSVKAFITRREDTYVPKWIREAVSVPRHSVFGASTNDHEFLSDPTGNRRFWVIKVPTIDYAWLGANRDQLFAQAVHSYRAGEQWWLTKDFEQLNNESNSRFEVVSPWQNLINAHVEEKMAFDTFRTDVLLSDVLKIPPAQWPGAAQKVGAIMRRLGFEQVVVGKARVRLWRREGVSP